MSSGIVVAGLALAAVGFTGRYLLRHSKAFARAIPNELPSFNVSDIIFMMKLSLIYLYLV